jgi:flagellar biosynthesis/type III secretory pathway M-ring protein FliF/YscJ
MKNITTNAGEFDNLITSEKNNEIEKEKLPELSEDFTIREKTLRIAKDNPERTEQLIRSWLQGEQ